MSKFQILETYPEITILHHIEPDGTLWGSSGRKILQKRDEEDWQEITSFPKVPARDLFSFWRPTARALRADKCNIYVNSLGNILGIRASQVYVIKENKPPLPLFQINGDSVLHGGICEDTEGWSYVGEYFMNPKRDPARIWRISPELKHWEPAFTFEAGSIRHVHGIYPDPYDPDALWATTGDFENECYLFRTDNRFNSIQQFGDGTQMWRAVRIFFTRDHICWLTDSNLTQNYACRMRRSDGMIEIGQKIDASAWYGAMTSEGQYIAFTTVEPGPGIHTDMSSILISEDGFSWKVQYQFKKDYWRPMKLFKYGVISCPSGKMSGKEFYISGEGLDGLDGASLKVDIGLD